MGISCSRALKMDSKTSSSGCCDPVAKCCPQASCCTETKKCCPSDVCCSNKVDYNCQGGTDCCSQANCCEQASCPCSVSFLNPFAPHFLSEVGRLYIPSLVIILILAIIWMLFSNLPTIY